MAARMLAELHRLDLAASVVVVDEIGWRNAVDVALAQLLREQHDAEHPTITDSLLAAHLVANC
ncbi:hypothetical protein [Nocardia niwae]|uniref:hypothetical protein n=1 Tax=Nocardia niwae TaxID=626084 RepID=UPI0033C03C5B